MILERVTLIRTIITILLQIFYEMDVDSKVTVKSIFEPDVKFLKELVNLTFSFSLQDITIPGYVRKAPGLAQPTSPRSPPLPGVGAVAGAAGVGGDEKGELVRALSEEEARQLDQECHARFIKLSVKHITDGQVTCGKYTSATFAFIRIFLGIKH